MNGAKFVVELSNYISSLEFTFDDFIRATNFMETALNHGDECFKATITIVREEKANDEQP